MLTFSQSIVLSIISSGIAAGIIGGIFTYFLNRRFDQTQRVMAVRKEIYSKIHEYGLGFFDTASQDERQNASKEYVSLYRQTLLWGSEEVIKKFNNFLFVFDIKNAKTQQEIVQANKELIMAMRKDLTGETIDEQDINMYGKIF